MDGAQLPQGRRITTRIVYFLTAKFPNVTGSPLNDFGKGRRLSRPWRKLLLLTLEPLNR